MPLAPGVNLGPYEILAPLGAGGMGEVYRARDGRLGREVAVKVLPESVASDSRALSRFDAEMRAVAALSHPNILAIHDVGESGGVRYAVTELLVGETLRETMAGGPLPLRRTLEIAEQVALGLAAAHEKGIVHRDLKPENVFVTTDGHMKILDFGLARHAAPLGSGSETNAATVSAYTEPGSILGTIAYMSPEQARGQKVDYRSDQFSLGIVLYEMLSGERPFRAESAAETLTAIIREAPPPLEAAVPDVPVPVRLVVDRCLAKEPRERYDSTKDLARELGTWRLRSSDAAVLAPSPAPVPSAPSSAAPVTLSEGHRLKVRLRLVLAAAVVAAAAGGGLWIWRARTGAGPPLDPKRVAVAGLENRTGDRSLDALGPMAADLLAQGLSQIREIEVVSTGAPLPADAGSPRRRGKGAVRAVAEEYDAATVLWGAYYLEGETLRFQASMTDAVRGRIVQPFDPVSAPRSAPFPALEMLRQKVMGAAVTHFGGLSAHLEGAKAPRFDAYQEYLTGLGLFGANNEEAIRHFERAAEIDPGFLAPQLRLMGLYRQVGALAKAEAILRRLDSRRETLTAWERNAVDSARESVAGNRLEALRLAEQNLKLAPNDPNTRSIVGNAALALNRPKRAVEALTFPWPDVLTGSPLGAAVLRLKADALHLLEAYAEEAQVGAEAMRLYPGMMMARLPSGRSAVARGDVAGIERLIDESLSVQVRKGSPALVMADAAVELRIHGRAADGERIAERAVVWVRGRPEKERETEGMRVILAETLYAAGRLEEARKVFEVLASASPEDADYPGRLGSIAARRGAVADARLYLDQLARMDRPDLKPWSTYRRACVAAQLGDREGAVALLREAFSLGWSYGVQVHREIDLEPLRGYTPFDELMRPKG